MLFKKFFTAFTSTMGFSVISAWDKDLHDFACSSADDIVLHCESHAFLFLQSLNHVVGRKVRIGTGDWLYT